ncbi:hypothetical protein BJP08_01070 [Corynebacterium sp. NML140438]|nr:hypothetical protein BJP08_01070 [Corynebacterium sp. NML140438]
MKIRSLDFCNSIEADNCGQTLVIVESLEDALDLSMLGHGTTITESLEDDNFAGFASFARIVVINQNSAYMKSLADQLVALSIECFEVWTEKKRFYLLSDVFEVSDEWAVTGMHKDEQYLQLILSRSKEGDRGSGDIRALLAQINEDTEIENRPVHRTIPENTLGDGWALRELILTNMIKRAKPLKRVLPAWTVRLAYKALRRIR